MSMYDREMCDLGEDVFKMFPPKTRAALKAAEEDGFSKAAVLDVFKTFTKKKVVEVEGPDVTSDLEWAGVVAVLPAKAEGKTLVFSVTRMNFVFDTFVSVIAADRESWDDEMPDADAGEWEDETDSPREDIYDYDYGEDFPVVE